MGIRPMVAVWTSIKQGDIEDTEYVLTLQIDIGSRVCEPVLGDLPAGWEYHWKKDASDKTELSKITCEAQWFDCGFAGKSLENKIGELVKEFEAFLDTRDKEAVKSLLLLTNW